jgi:hypothetical protein
MKKYVFSLLFVCVLATSASAQSNFTFTAKKDPITDEDSSFIMTKGAENPETALIWRCNQARETKGDSLVPFDVVFVFGGELERRNSFTTVTVRFAPSPAVDEMWWVEDKTYREVYTVNTDLKTRQEQEKRRKQGKPAPDPAQRWANEAVEFTKHALESPTATLRVKNYPGTPYTETFNLTGLAEALRQLPCAAGLFTTAQ